MLKNIKAEGEDGDSDSPLLDDSEKSPPKKKQKRKPRKLISLKTKNAIIADCETAKQNNTSFKAVADKWDVNPQSVSHIWKHRNEIRSHLQDNPEAARKNIMVKRSPTLHLVEYMLINWIDEQISKSISISKYSLYNQAKLWVEHFDEVLGTETHFQSSQSWIKNFFKRFGVNNISDLEVPTKKINDGDAVDRFVADLEDIILDGKYLPEQIFNFDECGVNWRFLPTNKAPKEHFTMLIGTNAAGDFKIKPILIHNKESPSALTHINKMTLPVTYRFNKSVTMTAEMMDNWFRRLFISQVKQYHQSKDIENKILLIVDSVPVHRKLREFESKKLKVVFMPPTVAHQVQPSVQGVANSIQVNFVRRLIKQAHDVVTNVDDPKEQLKEFWKLYTIRKAIEDIDKVWNEDITYSTIVRSWQKIYPKNPRRPSDLELPPYIRGPLADSFRPLLEPIVEDLVDFDGLKKELLDEILLEDSINADLFADKKSQHSSTKKGHHHHSSLPLNGFSSTSSNSTHSDSAAKRKRKRSSSTKQTDQSPSNDLMNVSDVLLKSPDVCASIQRLIGPDRYHLLMQVLSLPVKHVKLAQQLMILMATDSNGKSISIKRTPQTEKLCTILKEAYARHKKLDQPKESKDNNCNIN